MRIASAHHITVAETSTLAVTFRGLHSLLGPAAAAWSQKWALEVCFVREGRLILIRGKSLRTLQEADFGTA